MKKFIFLTLFFLTLSPLFAQIEITVKPVHINVSPEDTLQICQDSVTLYAEARYANGTKVTDSTSIFTWNFDDGTVISDYKLDTVNHFFTKPKGYYIRVTVIDSNRVKNSVIYPIKVSLTPDFAGTSVTPDEPICAGDQVILSGVVKPTLWKYQFPTGLVNSTENFSVISRDKKFFDTIDHRSFSNQKLLDSVSQIDSIVLMMEHTNASDLYIKLTCPSGKYVILKKRGGDTATLGEPSSNNLTARGKMYRYIWRNSGTKYGKMRDEQGKYTHTYLDGAGFEHKNVSYLPKGSYLPETPLDSLVGCPLNGNWIFTVIDSVQRDNGTILYSALFFDTTIIPKPLWEYFTPIDKVGIWEGRNVNSTNEMGIATANPDTAGDFHYSYIIYDSWGCTYSASVVASVEKVTITANPLTSEIPPPTRINFENKTSWGKSFDWDFGDKSVHGTAQNSNHEYADKGIYKVKLTVTSEQGCTDWDTIAIKITIKPSSIDEFNVFSPNKDGLNDKLKLKIEALKSLNAKIYSRWGQVVCEWNSPEDAEKGWDGTVGNNGGSEAAPGVYYYIIEAEGLDGEKFNKKGFIHLFRGN